jgi:hypothetical protein
MSHFMNICHTVLELLHAKKHGRTTGTFLQLSSANVAERWSTVLILIIPSVVGQNDKKCTQYKAISWTTHLKTYPARILSLHHGVISSWHLERTQFLCLQVSTGPLDPWRPWKWHHIQEGVHDHTTIRISLLAHYLSFQINNPKI